MITENIKTTGKLHIVLRDTYGRVKFEKVLANLVVSGGKNVIASRLTGAVTPVMSSMALGTGNVAATSSDASLGAEIPASRQPLVIAGGTSLSNVITYSATFSAGVGTGPLTEAGIFNDSVAGSMLCRTTFTVVNKDALDSLTIVWKITIN